MFSRLNSRYSRRRFMQHLAMVGMATSASSPFALATSSPNPATPGEFEVESYLLLTRSRYEHPNLTDLSCVRHDLLRSDPGVGFKLARREIIVDESVLRTQNLAVFL